MAGMRGHGGRRNRQNRAQGMVEAIPAHPAGTEVGQPATAACPDHKQITRVARDDGKDGAGSAALDNGLDRQIGGKVSPRRVKRLPQPLPGVISPEAAQVWRGTAPFGDVTARRRPGMNGYQDGVIGAGKVFRVAQRAEVAR